MDDTRFMYFPTTEIGTPYEGCFSFKVNVDKEILVSLSNAAHYSDPKLFFLIGGWSNTKSAIMKDGNRVAEIPTPNLLRSGEYRSFWIKWDNGSVEFGKKGEIVPLLKYYDSLFYPFNFVGILGSSGGSGYWIFEESNCPGYNATLTKEEINLNCEILEEKNHKFMNSINILTLYKIVLDEINLDFQYYKENRELHNLSHNVNANLNALYGKLIDLNTKAWIALENGEILEKDYIESKKFFNEIQIIYLGYLEKIEFATV